MPPARLGILYGWKGVDRLVRSIGLPAAKELLLTGQLIDASRAYDLGLISVVVPAGALLDEARAVTDTLAANAPLSVAASKRMTDLLSAGAGLSDDALSELASIQQRVWTSDDAAEGARAYRERRPPQFTGS
jgi:enoyl-CoA hydratase/carnithine racemase